MRALIQPKTTIGLARASAMASGRGTNKMRLPAARFANEQSPAAAAVASTAAFVTPAEQWEALVSAMCDVRDECVCACICAARTHALFRV
jgi:hypothetical protein